MTGKLTTPAETYLFALENNATKDVAAIRFAWTIAPAVSCNSAMQPIYKEGKIQEVKIAQGASLLIKAPDELQINHLLEIAKAGAIKTLVANVGILEVTFSDGSKWTDKTLAATKQFMNGEVEKNTPCEMPAPKANKHPAEPQGTRYAGENPPPWMRTELVVMGEPKAREKQQL